MLTRSHQPQSSNSPPFIFVWPLQSPQPGKYLTPLAWPRARGWTEVFGVECYSPCKLGACHAVRRHPAPGPAAKLCHGNPAARREGLGGSCWVKAIKLLLRSWFEAGSFPLPWHGLFPAGQPVRSQLIVVLAGAACHTLVSLEPPCFLQGQKKGKMTRFCTQGHLRMVGLTREQATPESRAPARCQLLAACGQGQSRPQPPSPRLPLSLRDARSSSISQPSLLEVPAEEAENRNSTE